MVYYLPNRAKRSVNEQSFLPAHYLLFTFNFALLNEKKNGENGTRLINKYICRRSQRPMSNVCDDLPVSILLMRETEYDECEKCLSDFTPSLGPFTTDGAKWS
jgi:hypothetical protein